MCLFIQLYLAHGQFAQVSCLAQQKNNSFEENNIFLLFINKQ